MKAENGEENERNENNHGVAWHHDGMGAKAKQLSPYKISLMKSEINNVYRKAKNNQ
jgi:hypothetical protein